MDALKKTVYESDVPEGGTVIVICSDKPRWRRWLGRNITSAKKQISRSEACIFASRLFAQGGCDVIVFSKTNGKTICDGYCRPGTRLYQDDKLIKTDSLILKHYKR